jgi:hypothetical protein
MWSDATMAMVRILVRPGAAHPAWSAHLKWCCDSGDSETRASVLPTAQRLILSLDIGNFAVLWHDSADIAPSPSRRHVIAAQSIRPVATNLYRDYRECGTPLVPIFRRAR